MGNIFKKEKKENIKDWDILVKKSVENLDKIEEWKLQNPKEFKKEVHKGENKMKLLTKKSIFTPF